MKWSIEAAGGRPCLLYAEDFDAPARVVEPEVIAPVYTEEDMARARREGAEQARVAAEAEAAARQRHLAQAMLVGLPQALREAGAAASQMASDSAESLAATLLAALRAALPALCARHGAAEAAAVLAALRPVLGAVPRATIRLDPHTASLLRAELTSLQDDLPAEITITASDALSPGDVQVVWHDGAARRDVRALLARISELLGIAGLLPAATEDMHAA